MLRDYQIVLDRVTPVMEMLGFVKADEDNFSATFEGPEDWNFVIDGDRVSYPAFSLLLIKKVPGTTGRSYSLARLMKAFALRNGEQVPKPSLDNQLAFLRANAAIILGDEPRYAELYRSVE